MTMLRSTGRQFAVAAKALALFTLLLGIAYPLLATAAAQTAAGHLANGSPVSAGGNVTGSALLGCATCPPQERGRARIRRVRG